MLVDIIELFYAPLLLHRRCTQAQDRQMTTHFKFHWHGFSVCATRGDERMRANNISARTYKDNSMSRLDRINAGRSEAQSRRTLDENRLRRQRVTKIVGGLLRSRRRDVDAAFREQRISLNEYKLEGPKMTTIENALDTLLSVLR
jgi:hypothetical protein